MNVFDFLSPAEITAVETNNWSVVTNVTASVQSALTASAGKRLSMPEGTYRTTAALTFPDDIEIEGEGGVFQSHVYGGEFATTENGSHIKFSRIAFESAGTYSVVMTFTKCDWVELDHVVYNGALSGSLLSSIFLRSFGSKRIRVRGGRYYDCDNFVYLDKDGSVLSDDVHISGAHFEHRFLGNSDNPCAVYAFNAGTVKVDGHCTSLNIAAGGSAPIAGYFVYEGDGVCDSLTVKDCESRMTIAKPHVMVQASNSKHCEVSGGNFYGKPFGATGQANYLFNGGGIGSVVRINENYSEHGAVVIAGGGSLANATKLAQVRGNTFNGVDQTTSAIRFGIAGTHYVDVADCRDNVIEGTRASGVNFSQVSRIKGGGDSIKNWNTGNYATHGVHAYTAGVYIEGTPTGKLKDLVISNASGQYGRVGIAGPNTVKLRGNEVSGVLDAPFVGISQNEPVSGSRASSSALSMTHATPHVIASVSLPVGKWIISGAATFFPGETTSVQIIGFGSSLTETYGAENTFSNLYNIPAGVVYGGNVGLRQNIPVRTITVTEPSTLRLIASAFFDGTMSACGEISATPVLD